MFDNAFRARTAARTTQALYSALDDWRDSDGGWFNGTVASVDSRLGTADSLLHRFRQAGLSGYGIVAELSADRDSLTELRHSMLNAHTDRDVTKDVRLASIPERLMIQARAYVRDNIEVAHVPDEMRDRARHYWASTRDDGMSAQIFAQACVDVAAQVPRPQPQRTAATVADFDDHHLFL